MLAIASSFPGQPAKRFRPGLGGCRVLLAIALGLSACRSAPTPAPRAVQVQQTWELQPGGIVAGFPVAAGLGDISLTLGGAVVRAPFNGEVEPAAMAPQCVLFSSPEVPAYLFRYCGLGRSRLGPLRAGEVIGPAQVLHFATLRRQPDGTWALVEPSSTILERSLQRP